MQVRTCGATGIAAKCNRGTMNIRFGREKLTLGRDGHTQFQTIVMAEHHIVAVSSSFVVDNRALTRKKKHKLCHQPVISNPHHSESGIYAFQNVR